MLSELPSEIIYQIATYLPTANALAHLSQTCYRLHRIITAENSRIFRAFVRSRFPSTQTPPFWKDAAQALTSRSRALDRKAIIGRFAVPPQTATKIGSHEVIRQDNPTLGYRPSIDSYEIWNGQRWADRKEVLAWGAANLLVMRIKQTGARSKEDWLVFNDVDHISSYDDICSLHLLSSGNRYSDDTDMEHLIFGRVRGDIAHLAISPNEGTFEYKQKFVTNGLRLDKTDLSSDTDPTLAAHFDNGYIAFYHTETDKEEIQPFTWLRPEGSSRTNYSKLLSSSLVAVGTGNVENSLSISKITPDGISAYRNIGIGPLDTDPASFKSKANISAIEPLNNHAISGSPGEVFLAAWDDYAIRLHDLRSPRLYEVSYRDITDLNPIYSLHAFGHERFLAGAGGEALVKIFDLRMCNTYDYLDAQIPASQWQGTQTTTNTEANITPRTAANSRPWQGFSMFLSHQPPLTFPQQTQAPVRTRRRGPYRGPIYTMSSPSPSSPTVYTGVVDGVVQLDFASTDDLTGPQKEWYETNLDLGVNIGPEVSPRWNSEPFNLAGYERPDEDDFVTVCKLRNQRAFRDLEPRDVAETHTGWDCRWKDLDESRSWRRRDR
ncbi:uncharacterized protein N7479_004098 [Penicillium vulpinum]|uniref:F-box domain-containing protein n=1 Tax=Penicillium vulpinum TaxID=29845 RepID=A0A1V6SCP3_9EURO|nr:uncharacterized protein N7479_004098 [Penicillium vulpinum]KAJ5964222.1 hypothetical protein N7479_004098 [Penicillium vulpinum]OQE11678.1 hypothetical protein PENVUL_c002G01152 [Penicillium vulpinum]